MPDNPYFKIRKENKLRIHPGKSKIGLINFQNFDQKSQNMSTFDQKTSSETSGPQVKFLAPHESAVITGPPQNEKFQQVHSKNSFKNIEIGSLSWG